MSGGDLTVATLNLENGRELDLLPRSLPARCPAIDILFFQEARAFDFDGQKAAVLAPRNCSRRWAWTAAS